MSSAYIMRSYPGILTDRLRRYWLLRDQSDWLGEATPATTSPSDYFAQLATWLDEVCMTLDSNHRREIAKLQRIVDDLLYLYSNYEIKKKM